MNANEILAQDLEARQTELWKEQWEVSCALDNAKEGTAEYRLLSYRKQALRREEKLINQLRAVQIKYNFLREHVDQLARYFNGN